MRYIKRGKKIVAIYSEHNIDGNQCKKRNQCVKRGKQSNNNSSSRRPYINSKSKAKVPTNEMNKNTANKKKPTVHHEQPSTNQSRTPMEVFVEAIRNMQREMAGDTNFTSSGMNM